MFPGSRPANSLQPAATISSPARATPEQTANITAINKAILYSVFRHYCEVFRGDSSCRFRDESMRKNYEKITATPSAFLCRQTYRGFSSLFSEASVNLKMSAEKRRRLLCCHRNTSRLWNSSESCTNSVFIEMYLGCAKLYFHNKSERSERPVIFLSKVWHLFQSRAQTLLFR